MRSRVKWNRTKSASRRSVQLNRRSGNSPPLPAESFEGAYEWGIESLGLGIQLPGRMVFFSDDRPRYSQVPSDFALPEIIGREESLADSAVAGSVS